MRLVWAGCRTAARAEPATGSQGGARTDGARGKEFPGHGELPLPALSLLTGLAPG